MRERGIELKVGLLVIVALGLLAALIITLGNFSLKKGISFNVDFDFIGNMHTGAPVKVTGIKVGKVRRIDFLGGKVDPETKRRVYVRVNVWIENRAAEAVHSDAEFFVNTQGVLGEQYLEIVPGSPDKPTIRAGQTLIGVAPPRADLVIARLYEFLDGVTKLLTRDKETISNLLRASAKAVTTVDTLLLDNRDQIKRLLGTVETFTSETTQLVKGLRSGIGDPRRLSRMLDNLERTTASVARDADDLLAKAKRALDGVANISDAVGPKEKKRLQKLIARLSDLSDRAYALTGDAKVMVGRLVNGKGTAGALLARDELYDDIKEMVRDLKRNPWKFLWRE